MWRKIPLKLSVFICLLCVVLSGCGKKENIHELGIDGFVYVAEQVELQNIPADNFRVRDGYLYYRFGDYGSGTDLRRFPIEELLSGNVQKLPAGESLFAAGSRPDYIVDYTIDREGWIYCLEERRDAREVPLMRPLEGMDGYMLDETEISYVLVKRRPDGEEGYCVSLADTPRCLAAGEQGMVYVAAIDSIYAVDGEGRMLDRIALDADTAGELLEGEGGSVYYDPMNGGNEIYEIDASDSFRLQRMEGPCTMGGSFAGSGDGLLYSGNDGLLYRCGRAAVSWKPVLRWGDSSLSVRGFGWEVFPVSEDRLGVSCSVSRRDAVNGKEVYLLTRTPVEELPEKEVLVMAGSLMYDKLEQYVMSFNRNSREYHIIIQNYGEAELDAALVSSDPPDLINLTGLDHGKCGQKDVLEDLTPYLEESSLLDREAFLEAVLEAGTVKGRLVCIPDEITCTTVVGRSSQVGTSAGWTAADAMALAEAHPEAELFINNSFSAMVGDFFGDYILERYVDWEKGKCSFDGEEFVAFMKWVAEHSGSADSGAIPMETLIGTMPEERLLSIWSDIRSLDRLLYDRAYFGEKVTAVGYPAADGSVCHHGTLINHMGIVTASERKEGAWRFLESFLSREDGIYTFLPSRRDRLEEMARGLMAEEKEDGSFEARVRIFIPDNINQYYAGLTGEEVDEVLGIIESADFTPQEGVRKDILNILVEEMSPCLNGDKTYEEAAAIVQNRVQTCLNER